MVIPEKKTKNAKKKNLIKCKKIPKKNKKIQKTEKNQKIKKLSHRW